MGYTTDFEGSLKLTPSLNEKQTEYINRISSTRRMKRNPEKLMELYKGKHGNPFVKNSQMSELIYGKQGEFFAMDDGQAGQLHDNSIEDYNGPPSTQPGLWCQWQIFDNGASLEWDGEEKFYNYIEWLKYIIKTFFIPWGIVADGEIRWFGEDKDDMGKIKVKNNEVFIFNGEVTFSDEK
jgi:hypothetical protein